MENKTKGYYVNLLIICITALICFVAVITFSNYKDIPSWSDIYAAVFGEEEPDTKSDYIRFIDVGQGDSILITSNGRHALVDFGNQSDFGSELLNALEGYGVKELDCVILSHYDKDHVGGAAKVIRGIKTHYALLPEQDDRTAQDFDDILYALENGKTEVSFAKAGAVVNVGDCRITVLNYSREEKNSNDRSVVLMAELNGIKTLLTGDAGKDIELKMLEDGIRVDCDIYKAAHHGSRNSNCKEFVTAASPEYAVISAGANQYGHPHDEVMQILKEANAKIYRTDRSGDIEFNITNGIITVGTEY
ncbi:MAG: ComEC/Rec2 family competence protein [Acutalibacteraceae bacterium]|nr:ComEC/Rec2 family competence protein [Acutalibacteraceae bacterium]